MTDTVQTICISEGMPSGASPSLTLTALQIRREKERQDKIDIALATANLILGGFAGKGDTLEAVRHMFTDEEVERILTERGRAKEQSSRMAQIEMLKRMCRQ